VALAKLIWNIKEYYKYATYTCAIHMYSKLKTNSLVINVNIYQKPCSI